MKRGDVVLLSDRAVFKLGIIIGVSRRAVGADGRHRWRVRPWQNASRRWSTIQTIDQSKALPVHVHSPNEHRTHRNALAHRYAALGGGK